jgi:hypothetical protein
VPTEGWRALFTKVPRTFASLQPLTLKPNGAAKKSDLAKLWQFFTAQIIGAVQFRVDFVRALG